MILDDQFGEVIRKAGEEVAGSAPKTTYLLRTKNVAQIVTKPFDEVQASYPSNTVEIYQFILGGVLQQTVTVTYTNASKADLQSAVVT